MNQQSTLEQLQELKLSGMAKRYEAILNHIGQSTEFYRLEKYRACYF